MSIELPIALHSELLKLLLKLCDLGIDPSPRRVPLGYSA